MALLRRIVGGLLLVFGSGVLAGTVAYIAGNDNAVPGAAFGMAILTSGYLLWKR